MPPDRQISDTVAGAGDNGIRVLSFFLQYSLCKWSLCAESWRGGMYLTNAGGHGHSTVFQA